MFIYMSKKIAIPKNTGVSCIAWNQTSGLIAVGGDEGMLKVLKLESGGGGNLSMNLSLEGHSGQLQVATWNEVHQKLTTSDQHGVIIVWMLYKGSWYEEMINNRNKSTVRGMAWSSDGQKICIAYEDGAVIVGSVDGSRVWGKDLKGIGLSSVQWSPDNTLLLFALSTGELNMYDNQGNFAMPVNVQCSSLPMDVVGLDWYAGQVPADRPVLAVCYRNGRIQLMRGYNDDDVVILDTGLEAVSCKWNHNGNVIAVAGIGKEDANVVQFFGAYGEHLRTLKVPAGLMRAISWEGRSLRVAIAVDSFIYFANVKPDHKRAFFGTTLVFCSGPDSVTFWDTSTHQTWVNHIPGVVDICGIDEYCVIATQHALVVSNQQGIQCDGKVTSIGVSFVAMNAKGTIVAASKNTFLVWKFATPMRPATPEQIFYTDGSIYVGEKNSAQDPICCIACSDTILLIGLESGAIVSFSMLNMKKLSSYSMPTKPYKMALNSNSSKFFVIDSTGGFFILDTEMASNLGVGQPLKRDVWGAIWAMDNPQLISVAEKARLYILRGTEPEEPLTAQGYLCRFQDLEITSVLLDDLEDKFNGDFIVRVEVKSLRDTRQLLDKVGLKEAESFIQDNPHPKLWQLLAEAALRKCEETGALETAEASYVRRSDYAGVRFVRRLAALHTPALRNADVLAFFKEFDAAEKIYLEEDRRDLAISMRRRLGHWFKVVELLKMSANTSDNQIMDAYNNIGDHYIDRQNWLNAIEYYNMANNTEGLTKCYIATEDNESLATLQNKSPRKPVLKDTSSKTSLLSTFGLIGGNDQLISGNKLNFKDVNKQDTPSVSNIIHLKEAGRFQHAAMEAYQLARLEASKKQSPTKIKKLYVLAGIFYSQTSLDGSSNRDAIQSYRCAAAQHWLGLAASLTLARPFRADAAMRAATRLQQVINLLDEEQIPEAWSIVAMIAAEARAFATCSKAFVKLEALPNGEAYSDLAVELFLKYSPKDPKGTKNECPSCQMSLSDWMTACPDCEMEFPGCSITGRPLYDKNTVWICKMCHQATGQQELVLRHSCPICHASIS